METVGRLFLAVDLSVETRRALAVSLEGSLNRIPGRLVPPPNWHLTMRFLGDVGPVDFDKLVFAITGADLGNSFTVTFGRPGAFPRPERATVVWLGIEGGAKRLSRLADVVEKTVRNAGFPSEDRPYRAHLTLSRVRPAQDVTDLLAGSKRVGLKSRIDALTLFRSHLGRGGATYEVLERFPLA